jgi:hypothetical protein
MTPLKTAAMNREDRLITQIVIGFLTTPLLLMMGAAAVIAL